jgi:hypothetical protein
MASSTQPAWPFFDGTERSQSSNQTEPVSSPEYCTGDLGAVDDRFYSITRSRAGRAT